MKIEEEMIFPKAVTVVLKSQEEYTQLKELERQMNKDTVLTKKILKPKRRKRRKYKKKVKKVRMAKKDSWLSHKNIIKKTKQLDEFKVTDLIKQLGRPITKSTRQRVSVHVSNMKKEGIVEKIRNDGNVGVYKVIR